MTVKKNPSGGGHRRKKHEKRPTRTLEEALSAMREKVATGLSQVMFDLGDIGTNLVDEDLENKMRRALSIYVERSEPNLSVKNQAILAEKLWEDWFGPNGLAYQPPKARAVDQHRPNIRYGAPMGTLRKRAGKAAKKTAQSRQAKASQPKAVPPKAQEPKVVAPEKPADTAPPTPVPDETGEFWGRSDIMRDAAAHARAIEPREKDEGN